MEVLTAQELEAEAEVVLVWGQVPAALEAGCYSLVAIWWPQATIVRQKPLKRVSC